MTAPFAISCCCLCGETNKGCSPVLVEPDEVSDFLGREEGFAAKKAPRMPMIADEERLKGKGEAEVETGYHQDVAIAEARRCLRCEMRLKVCCPPKVPQRVAEEVGAEA